MRFPMSLSVFSPERTNKNMTDSQCSAALSVRFGVVTLTLH